MSRSGYNDDWDDCDLSHGRWRGMVASAERGRRGQALLRDIALAMTVMPVKRLIREELENDAGEVCALGAAGRMRGVDMSTLDPEDPETIAGKFNVADCLVREISYLNDDWGPPRETPEQRYVRMRRLLRARINDPLFDVVWC